MSNLFSCTLKKLEEKEIDDGYVQFSEKFLKKFLYKQENKWLSIVSDRKIKFSDINNNEINSKISNEMSFTEFVETIKEYSEKYNESEKINKEIKVYDSLYVGPIHNEPNFKVIEEFKTKIAEDFIFEFKISSKLFEYFNYSGGNQSFIQNIKINNKYRVDFNYNRTWTYKYFCDCCFQIDKDMQDKDLTKKDIETHMYDKIDLTYETCESIVQVFTEIAEIYYENNEEKIHDKVYNMNI